MGNVRPADRITRRPGASSSEGWPPESGRQKGRIHLRRLAIAIPGCRRVRLPAGIGRRLKCGQRDPGRAQRKTGNFRTTGRLLHPPFDGEPKLRREQDLGGRTEEVVRGQTGLDRTRRVRALRRRAGVLKPGFPFRAFRRVLHCKMQGESGNQQQGEQRDQEGHGLEGCCKEYSGRANLPIR